MKIYQCIHKYIPHIPLFEARNGVTDEMDYETLHRLLIEDGYASTYALGPALALDTDQVFFTIWDYDRLQRKWAEKHGFKAKNLTEIKLAQVEEYQPDVFYNFSAFCDDNFIRQLGKRKDRKDIYWNGIIQPEPMTFPEYEGQISLHRPYVEYWKKQGLKAKELQPGIPSGWSDIGGGEKEIDVLFYGQFFKGMFDNRNQLIEDLLRYKLSSGVDVRCHLTYKERRSTIFRIRGLPSTTIRSPFIKFPSSLVRKHSFSPLYGRSLYEEISKARIVVNAYTNDNSEYKSNMRLFEAIGLGAFLISEEGNYPEGFEPGVDFYTYRSSSELITQIERVLSDWPTHAEMAANTRKKISQLYSKERQWQDFLSFVEEL